MSSSASRSRQSATHTALVVRRWYQTPLTDDAVLLAARWYCLSFFASASSMHRGVCERATIAKAYVSEQLTT